MTIDSRVIEDLFAVIQGRQGADPDTSYTAKLFAKGRTKIAQKVGEEATETVIAALAQGPEKVVTESADLLYHLLVLWAECGVQPQQIWDELHRRIGTSGIAEKASRNQGS